MNFQQIVKKRRAVKHYDASHQLSAEEQKQFWDLVLESPTSFNIQNWRFVHVEDMELRKQIRKEAWDQAQITDASMLIVLCGDIKAWSKEPSRYWKDAPKEVADTLVPMIGQFYEGREQMQRDEVLRSCGIAAQTMMLSATSMGYDSCPMIGFDQQKVAEIINLPKDHEIAMIVVVGKKTSDAHPKGGQLDASKVVVKNKFS